MSREALPYLTNNMVRLQEAYRKYDELASRHVDVLRRLTKSIQDGRKARDNEAIKKAINEYDEALEVRFAVCANSANPLFANLKGQIRVQSLPLC